MTAVQSLVAAAELAGGESAAGTVQLPWLSTLALTIDVLIAIGEWRSSGWSPPFGPQSVTSFANSLCETHPTTLRAQINEMLQGSPFERGLHCEPPAGAIAPREMFGLLSPLGNDAKSLSNCKCGYNVQLLPPCLC